MPLQERAETVAVADAMEMPSPTGPPPVRKPSLDDYPESDGKPMAETPWHIDAMFYAIGALKQHFRERADAYVGGNMMMYYVEDDTQTSVSPDVFVTFGVGKLPERRVWRTWTERGRFADFVLEVTSKSSRKKDEGSKKELYARLGVGEYWQFDPTGEYLDPILKGHRLDSEGRYEPLALEERDGGLCHESILGLELRLEDGRLRLFDPASGDYLLTGPEKDELLREQAEALRRATTALRATRAENADLKRSLDRGE